MASTITASVVTGGSNSHATTAAEVNALGTDFLTAGCVGTLTNTNGVAPNTGSFAVNAQGTPAMFVDVTAGTAWITATPAGQSSQKLRASMTANYTSYAISANASGSTKYDWIYLQVDATKANNPASDASDVISLVTSRSSSNSADNGTPPTYGILLAVVTVANGASSITNANITDSRTQSVVTETPGSSRVTGELVPYAGRTAPTGWLLCDGSAISRSTYGTLFGIISPAVGTFTITIAAPAVVTLTGHGLRTGSQVYLTTTGALPTGLSANTLYYVVKVDSNTFNLATSRANAYAGTKITTTGSQSGIHTLTYCPYGLGDGSTTFNIPDIRGRVLAGDDAMGGTAASRLTLAQSQGSYGNLGASGGEQGHQITTAESASHSHTSSSGGSLVGTGSGSAAGITTGGGGYTTNTTTSSSGSDTAHNNVQPTLVLNYIIKT